MKKPKQKPTLNELLSKKIMKEDKFSLFYLLRMLDHKTWFYRYEESYTKKELQTALLNLLKTKPEKFKEAATYRAVIDEYNNDNSLKGFLNSIGITY